MNRARPAYREQKRVQLGVVFNNLYPQRIILGCLAPELNVQENMSRYMCCGLILILLYLQVHFLRF